MPDTRCIKNTKYELYPEMQLLMYALAYALAEVKWPHLDVAMGCRAEPLSTLDIRLRKL